jgi:amino acid adenylation domain-containing protein
MIDTKRLYRLRMAAGKKSKERNYWLKQFAGEPVKSSFPAHRSSSGAGGVRHSVFNSLPFRLDEKLSAARTGLSSGSLARLHIILAASLMLLLHKYTGSTDIIIGTPVYKAESDREPVNTVLPLRVQVTADMPFKEFLAQVKRTMIEAVENRNYPMEVLIDKLGMPAASNDFPLFDTAISVEGLHGEEYLHRVNPGMIFSFGRRGECIAGKVDYNTALYNRTGMERITGHFKNLAQAALSTPDANAVELDILSAEEKKQLLVDFNDTAAAYPADQTIHRLFEEQVERTGDRAALIYRSSVLTYRELNRRSDELAAVLREKGVRPDDIAAIKMERSIEMIAGILGILKAGGAYLPIETGFPQERIDYMLKDSSARLLLSKDGVTVLPHSAPGMIPLPGGAPEGRGGSLAYVIYTSGTTGKPRGVLTMHRGVTRAARNTNYIDITPGDRLLQLSNYAFDGSVFDIFAALLNGAALVILEPDDIPAVERLAGIIKREAVTVFFVTTALFNTLVDLNPDCLDNVRKILFGGERVSVEHARKALGHLGKNRLIHMYGPTETTVYASYYFIDAIEENALTIPIGKPLANTVIYILDKYINMTPIGVSGEIYIGGKGNARGYLNSPELTAERFVYRSYKSYRTHRTYNSKKLYKTGDLARWLPDGNIEFIGRMDHQVKIRGFRVELGEIESRLAAHPGIKEVAAVVTEKGAQQYICGYFTGDEDLSSTRIREYLSGNLPHYMIPSYFVHLEKIPLTANGKLDRRALPEPETGRKPGTDYVPPNTGIEKKLVDIWSEVFTAQNSIGVDDNFFDLGGQSILAMRMTARLRETFQVEIPLSAFFREGTIRRIAQMIESIQAGEKAAGSPDEEESHSLSTVKLEKVKRVKEDL